LARLKCFTGFHHFAALPPLGVDLGEDLLLPLAYDGQLIIVCLIV